MSILFERKVESGDDSAAREIFTSPSHSEDATPVMTGPDGDLDALERIDQLEDEVDHLRACIDQILDMVDSQFDTAEALDLLSDRMSLFERRMQRVEDGMFSGQRASKRRAGEK